MTSAENSRYFPLEAEFWLQATFDARINFISATLLNTKVTWFSKSRIEYKANKTLVKVKFCFDHARQPPPQSNERP